MGSCARAVKIACPKKNGVTKSTFPDMSSVEKALDIGLIQTKPVGAVLPGTKGPEVIPKLFTPMKIRGLTMENRIMVSPMCMYSSATQDGKFSNFHLVHYGSFALRGAGLVTIEATAVSPEGRLSPEDTGLYNREQMESLKTIVDFVHASGSKIGIQLAHGGRKAAAYPPFHNFEESHGQMGRGIVPESEGGFPDALVSASPIPWKEGYSVPRELSIDEIQIVVNNFAKSAKLAVEAGVDMIMIHGAFGYLIHQFLSGHTNKRTDKYGGNFQNRIRFLLEIVTAMRAVMPEDIPLFLRLSGTDFATSMDLHGEDPSGWDIIQVTELCKQVVRLGVDLVDLGAGGNSSGVAGMYSPEFGFLIPLAETVRAEGIKCLKLSVSGNLGSGVKAEQALQDGKLDLIVIGREFVNDPNVVYTMAKEFGLKLRRALQYSWFQPDFY